MLLCAAMALIALCAGSVETVRKIVDLGRVPDVVAVADTALFSRLMPGWIAGPVVALGSSRLVRAYTDKSKFAGEVSSNNWPDVTTRPGVEVGRSAPALDPAGYRALMAMQLAERFYAKPGLEKKLEAAASTKDMRPKSADLAALLQTGNLDYAWEYESVARRLSLHFVVLPREVDLGKSALASTYAMARVAIPASGSTARGPKRRSARRAARGFITYLMSPQGRTILDSYGLVRTPPPAAADKR